MFISSLPAYSKEKGVELSFETTAVSDSASLYSLAGDWNEKPSSTGHFAFRRDRYYAGAVHSGWRLGYVYRSDWFFRFTPDTAHLVYLYQQKVSVPKEQVIEIDLQVNQLVAEGVSFGYSFSPDATWEVGVQLQLLQGIAFQEGRLSGQLSDHEDLGYKGQAMVNYHYDRDRLLEHQISQPSGQGVSVGFNLEWKSPPYYVSLVLEDVWMSFNWYDAPYTKGRLNSERTTTTPDGYLRYEPLLTQGIRGQQDFEQEPIPVSGQFVAGYDNERFRLEALVNHYWGLSFPELRISLPTETMNEWSVGYEFRSERWSLGYILKQQKIQLSVAVGADDFRYRQTQSFFMNLSTAYHF